jgi:hypothetical protein
VDSDAIGELDLRQLPLASKLPNFSPHQFQLRWLSHQGFVDFYAIEK